jgi:hypothetical protein
MRVGTVAIFGLFTSFCSLPASADPIVFPYNGLLNITAASPECGGRIQIDDIFAAIYRPLVSPDTTPGALHLYKERQAFRMEDKKKGQFRGSGSYDGVLLDGRGIISTYTGTYSNVVVTPKTIVIGTTEFITMVGTFTNFDNRTDCTVSFRASFNARAS